MNWVVVLFCLFLKTASGSMFGEFQSTMSTITHRFNRMVKDVAVDVRETIDCTILAIEETLKLGLFKTSEYKKLCKGVNLKDSEHHQAIHKIESSAQHGESEHDKAAKNICDMARNSYSAKLEEIKHVLQNNSQHLKEVSELLEEEIDILSKNASDQQVHKYIDIATQHNITTTDDIVKELHVVQDIEKRDKNTKRSENINKIVQELYKILNATNATLYSKPILTPLEQSTHIGTFDNILEKDNGTVENTESHDQTGENIPNQQAVPSASTPDLVSTIKDDSPEHTQTYATNSSIKPNTSFLSKESNDDNNMASVKSEQSISQLELPALLHVPESGHEEDKEIIDTVKNIIHKQPVSQNLFKTLFNKPRKSIFDLM